MLKLAVIITAATIAGCGSSTTTTTVTQTQTETVTVIHHDRTAARTITATQTVAATPPTATNTFSGNGSTNLGTITISTPSTIQWACQGCAAFGMASDPSGGSNIIALNSQATSGTSAVDPGTYTNVRVVSNGNWAIRIIP